MADQKLLIVIEAINKSHAETSRLLSDLKEIETQSDKTSTRFEKLSKVGDKMTGVGQKLSVGLTLPIAGIAVAATKFASDLSETRSKTNVLFGEMAESMDAWAGTANKAFGQSRRQALDGAADFAIFGKSAGLAGEDLTAFAKSNVELASDMASFFNTSPEEAVTAIGAAFRGEAEPIRRYGVLINDASLKQEAMRLGLIKTTTEALTPQQRVLAAQQLILQQTSAAQGDFARTSEGMANQSRIVKAQFEDTLAVLGEKLIPVATKGLGLIQGFLEAFQNLPEPMQDVVLGLGLVAAGLGPVLTIGGKVLGSLESLASGFNKVAGGSKLMMAELGLIAAGLLVIITYLERVSRAANATTDDLIKMSHSGDFFDQAAAATEILVNGQDRLNKAVQGVSQELKDSAPSYQAYIKGVLGAAVAARTITQAQADEFIETGKVTDEFYHQIDVTERVVQQTGALTEAQFNLGRSQTVVREETQAQTGLFGTLTDVMQQQISVFQDSVTLTAQQALGRQALAESTQAGGTAEEEYQKWLATSAAAQALVIKAEQERRASVIESIGVLSEMAQSLKDVTDAQAKQILAKAQLETLAKAYEKGRIGEEEFNQVTDRVLLNYDLATPKSLAMAQAQREVNKAYLEGRIPTEDFIESAEKIPRLASDGEITMKELVSLGIKPATSAVVEQATKVTELEQAWLRVPSHVSTSYTITTTGTIPPIHTPVLVPGRQSGGPVSPFQTYRVGERGPELLQMGSQGGTVTPINNSPSFNIVVNVGGGSGSQVSEIKEAIYDTVIELMEAARR